MADMVCPTTHIQAAKDFLKDCRKFLIIGTSGLDEDLLLLLGSAIHAQHLGVSIHVVDVDDKLAERTLKRFQRKVEALQTLVPVPGGSTYGIGFRRYADEKLQAFAKST